MKIYLDSADVSTWTLPDGTPPIQGVTTNPTLVHRANLPVTLDTYMHLVDAAGAHGFAELMVQLPSPDPVMAQQWVDTLIEGADRARVQLTIKLPCHADWLPCIRAVQQKDQPILLTGLSNSIQLLWAQSLQVDWVAPYVGRLDADGRDIWALMQACVAVQKAKGPALLAASIKSPEILARLMGCGAAAATLPPASVLAWRDDPLTQSAISQFERDIAASLA